MRIICTPCAVAFVRWQAKRSMLRGWTRSAKRMNTHLPLDIRLKTVRTNKGTVSASWS